MFTKTPRHKSSLNRSSSDYLDRKNNPIQKKDLKKTPRPNSSWQVGNQNQSNLPNSIKTRMEGLSGYSLDDVRVHYNSGQPSKMNALAFAKGSEIFLGPGQEKHLPHEAWHVVQQKQGRVKPTMQTKDGTAINEDIELEREADQAAKQSIDKTYPLIRSLKLKHAAHSKVSQRKILVDNINDGEPFEDIGGFVPKHWGFNDDEKKVFNSWISDSFIRKFTSKQDLRTNVQNEVASSTTRGNAIRDYKNLPRDEQTGTDIQKEAAVMAIANANRTSGIGYSWGAASHQAQWMKSKSGSDMFAQGYYAFSFARWQQGPGLYFALTNDPVRTVTWAKPDMANPNLMKISLTNVPTIDLNDPQIVAQIANIFDPKGTESDGFKAKSGMFGTNLPVLMRYGNVARLSSGVGVKMEVDMKSFLSKTQLQNMRAAAQLTNVQATLDALLTH